MPVKVRLKEMGQRGQSVEYAEPSGNRYTFYNGQWANIRDDMPQDIEFFKTNDRFEVEGFITHARDAVRAFVKEPQPEEEKKPEIHEPDPRSAVRASKNAGKPKDGE